MLGCPKLLNKDPPPSSTRPGEGSPQPLPPREAQEHWIIGQFRGCHWLERGVSFLSPELWQKSAPFQTGPGQGAREGRAGFSVTCGNSLHPAVSRTVAEQGCTGKPGCSPINSQVSLQHVIAGPQSEEALEASSPTEEVLSSEGTAVYLRLCSKLG